MKLIVLFCLFCSLLFGESNSTKEFPFEMAKSPLESINLFQYFGVILVLVGLLVFLVYIKRRINNENSFRFFKPQDKEAVKVISTTQLCIGSKLVVFESNNTRYLVVFSQNGALLVDKYDVSHFGDMLQQQQNEK